MQNLHLNDIVIHDLPINSSSIKKYLKKDNGSTYLVNGNVFYEKRNGDIKKINKKPVVDLEWNELHNVVYMATLSGFEHFHIDSGNCNEIVIENGYDVHAWNSSQDRVVVVLKNGLVRVLILDYYSNLYEEEAFCRLDVNDATCEIKGDMSAPAVAWTKEGDMFSVTLDDGGKKILYILSDNCEILGSNINIPYITSNLTWKPDGSMVGTVNLTDTECQLIFFEKNGYVRKSFNLNKTMPVRKFTWNNDHNLLYTLQENNGCYYVTLYSLLNNTWYSKQCLSFDHGEIVHDVNWFDSENSNICLEVLTSKNVIKYSWNWGVDSICGDENQQAILGVINDACVEVTVASDSLLPPPQNSYKLKFGNCVNFMRFSPNGRYLLVVLSDYAGAILKFTNNNFETFSFNLRELIPVHNDIPLALNNFVIDDKMVVYMTQTNVEYSALIKCCSELDSTDSETKYVLCVEELYATENFINNISLGEDSLILNTNVNVLQYNPDGSFYELCGSVPKGDIKITKVMDQHLVFSLKKNEFYLNDSLIANNVISYIVFGGYVLLTTNSNTLYAYKLSSKGLSMLKIGNNTNAFSREVPKDSVLIMTIPQTRSVVLLQPRGDIELIKPRILSVHLIKELVHENKYRDAFSMMRTDRINPNILIDLNPLKFIDDLENFVTQISDCELLNLFILSIVDTNISEELYGNVFESSFPVFPPGFSKKSQVLNSLVSAMQNVNRDHYMHSIIVAEIAKSTEDGLISALLELNRGIKAEKLGQKLSMSTDEVFNQITPLISIEQLYNIALMMQDFYLLQWIAVRSKLDPLEYIPFFTELENMPPSYRSYKINKHLKKFKDAFLNLIHCDNVEDELTDFVTKHNLFNLIVKHVPNTNQWYKPLMKLCGQHMSTEKLYEEAGFIFKCINDYEEALKNFVNAGNLGASINCIQLLKDSDVSFEIHYRKLCTILITQKQIKDACYVYEKYLNNYEKAVKLFIDEKMWLDAIHIAQNYNRIDLVETDIKASLLNYISELFNMLEQKKVQILKHKERLKVVRENRRDLLQNDRFHLEDEMIPMGDHQYIENASALLDSLDTDSVVSFTTTSTRKQSGYSSMSTASRNKKRQKRKILQTREGSMYENIALVREIHVLITDIQNYSNTIKDICLALMNFDDCYEKSFDLQNFYGDLMEFINRVKTEIWSYEFLNPPEPVTISSLALRHYIDQLELQYRYPPAAVQSNWKLYSVFL